MAGRAVDGKRAISMLMAPFSRKTVSVRTAVDARPTDASSSQAMSAVLKRSRRQALPTMERRPNGQQLPKRCVCGKDCAYHVLRCDHCQRGVHLHCIGMGKAGADQLIMYVCDSCRRDGVDVADVRRQRAAEGKPRAVVFKVTCEAHATWGQFRHGIAITPTIDYAPGETYHPVLPCDSCGSRGCPNPRVLCDRCEAECHYACVGMSDASLDRVDKWYCPRCLEEDGHLRITYKAGRDGEGDQHEQQL